MRKLKGIVWSHKMSKTAVVRVDRLVRHPRYHKYYRLSRKFKAETGPDHYQAGDRVVIQEVRPLSREKRWKIVERIARPDGAVADDAGSSGEEPEAGALS
ncbi:MAG: 30S ribosomal protein S17 [Candidatus Sungbacteria bacterium]|uniref:Small ribosomal subunit protein uS17 n=1 Tax=Candidatus Sungiibacteriota bacterium TaxID=2750080 RepID=A0A932VR20_9BACT|nr:30S ribosomal protein S17 [Candidatus Sungbacteria bacterium]